MITIGVTTLIVVSIIFIRAALAADRLASPYQAASFFSPATFTIGLFLLGFVWRPALYLLDPVRYSVFSHVYQSYDVDRVVALSAACLVGMAMFLIGFRSHVAERVGSSLPSLQWRSPLVCIAVLTAVAVFAIFAMKLLLAEVDLASLVLFSTEYRKELTRNWSGQGHIYFVLVNLNAFLCIGFIVLKSSRDRRPPIKLSLALLCAFFFIVGMMFNVVSVGRVQIIAAILTPLLLFHYYVRQVPVAVQGATLGFLLLVGGLIGLLMISANGNLGSINDFGILLEKLVWRVSGTLDQFEFLHLANVNATHFWFGLSYVEDLVLTYVPRSIFPDKPTAYGIIRLQDQLMPHLLEYASLSATYPVGFFAEAYLNFGYLGFVVVPLFYGMFLRALYSRGRTPDGPYAVLLIITLASTIAILRSLGSHLANIVFLFGICLLFCRFTFGSRKITGATHE